MCDLVHYVHVGVAATQRWRHFLHMPFATLDDARIVTVQRLLESSNGRPRHLHLVEFDTLLYLRGGWIRRR